MNDFIFHKDIINKYSSIENYIIYGQNGCGKYTIIKNILYNKFNINIDNSNKINYKTSINNIKYDLNIYKSIYHYYIIINKNTITYENTIINFLKTFINTHNICNKYNIFIIQNINNLFNLQNYICKYIDLSIHKFILICNNYSSIIPNLKSKCISVYVPIPNINNHLKIQNINNNNKKIIQNKYSYNLNIYFEALSICHKDNFEYILDNNKINIIFFKLLKIIKSKRLTNLDKIKDLIYDLLIFDINLIKEFYIFIYNQNIFKNDNDKILIINEFSKIEHLSKSGNNNIIYLENLIVFLKLLYIKI